MVAVKVNSPTPLPPLSVTITVTVALPRLVTVIGAALSAIAAGGPASITMFAVLETAASGRCCGEPYVPSGSAGGVGRAIGTVAIVCHSTDASDCRGERECNGFACHGAHPLNGDGNSTCAGCVCD